MNKNYFNSENLLILASHLLKGNQIQRNYQIQNTPLFTMNEDGTFEYLEPFFVEIINELPEVFPEDWHINQYGDTVWTLDKYRSLETSFQGFFGITKEATMHLLIPLRQDITNFGGKILLHNSTPMDIAINIIEMVCKVSEINMAQLNSIKLN